MSALRRPTEARRGEGTAIPVWVRVLAGVVMAAIGLAIAFRDLDLDSLLSALREARWSWFVASGAATIAAVWVRAWRWQMLLAPIEKVSIGPLFSATMIGYFGNDVLPLRLGELMRAVAFGRDRASHGGRVDVSTALGSIAVERLLDVVSALGFAALVVPFSGGLGGGIAAWSASAAIVIAAFGGLLWASRSPWLRRLIQARIEASRESRLGRLAASFLRGLLVLGEGPKLLPIGIATAIIWALWAAAIWTVARAASIPLTWTESGVVLIATAVAVAVPGAPGYVGTYHAAVVLVTADVLGHPTAQAQAFAILSHASAWLPTVVIGAICLLRSSVKLGEVSHLGEEAAQTKPAR